MLCKKLHHTGYRCKDARATVEFYTQVLGLKFSHAMGEDHVPSTGEYGPHIHLFFEMEDGASIGFFEVPHIGDKPMKDMEGPWQHFAFEVESVEALLQAKADFVAKGVEVLGPVNHDDFIQSIYFFDPSGHRLELTARTAPPARLKFYEDEAERVLQVWEKTRDWSQRTRLFGTQAGYARAANALPSGDAA